MNLLEKIRSLRKVNEPDPWEDHDPNAPQKQGVTEAEIQEAVEILGKPKPRSYLRTKINMGFIAVWGGLHLLGLYVMMGSPISGGFFIYVLIEIIIFSHYFWLLNKERKRNG